MTSIMPVKPRRKSVPVRVGDVTVGGSAPIVVQSMTNTDTADTVSTVNQVVALARAGSELVRVTVNTDDAAKAVPTIVETVRSFGVDVPIIGDFHYNGHLLLKKYPDCATALANSSTEFPIVTRADAGSSFKTSRCGRPGFEITITSIGVMQNGM